MQILEAISFNINYSISFQIVSSLLCVLIELYGFFPIILRPQPLYQIIDLLG